MSAKTTTKLPKGWRVELLGLINAVRFTNVATNYELLWSDGDWFLTAGRMMNRASGIPFAATQADARRIGTDFIVRFEGDR